VTDYSSDLRISALSSLGASSVGRGALDDAEGSTPAKMDSQCPLCAKLRLSAAIKAKLGTGIA
jgi:hypothetical protein